MLTKNWGKNISTFLLIISLACCSLCLSSCGESAEDAAKITENRQRLVELENQSIDDIQMQMYKRMDQERIPLLQQNIVNNCINPEASRKAFEGCVFLGDSVTYMAHIAGYITQQETSAYYSVHLKSCDEYVEAAINMHPEYMIFNFGANDMVMFGSNAQDFANKYKERCDYIKSKLPYVHIYITSVQLPNDHALAKNPGMHCSKEFNDAVKIMCEQNDRVDYLDTYDLAPKYPELRGPDGIHFKDAYYGYFYARVAQRMFLQK
ncbi:MAG: SGNH/GDSL hydrolase family protein [Coriobacteriales bacterium]|nr:SGNH/GDSL hydrolase family protein [Coriobacteriales bacterium]